MRGADDTSGDPFSVVVEHAPRVGQVHRHVVFSREAMEDRGIGDVDSVFEEQVSEGEAHTFAERKVSFVGGGGDGERGERACWKCVLGELFEQGRCDFIADVSDLFGDEVRVEWLTIESRAATPAPAG